MIHEPVALSHVSAGYIFQGALIPGTLEEAVDAWRWINYQWRFLLKEANSQSVSHIRLREILGVKRDSRS